ncbi:sensor histidine kinase [Chryseobacterium caseinilyticum]|uniref:histidine kinase n=1 Tax=Chryseobacterium caseinilyticum TaxID=2771428 RepID=A0ABR8ZEX4_9FLAO|nr:ATP-binding protein [Chryseobacterium caseinilyticum]MBD8083440.1 ATP-binding protein [Chryseobacterium caseinilyticum]
MEKTELLITVILFNFFFLGFIIAIMVYIRKYKQRKKEYLAEIQIKNEIHQKELLATQLEIQQSTMSQIGRELHDNIGQKLTLVSLYTQQLLHENKVPDVNERIEQVSEIVNQSIDELRSLSKSLTDNKISRIKITDLIRDEVSVANAVKKCKVSFEHNFEDSDLNFEHKSVVLRIIQEFIQNSMKHSECKNVFINLKSDEETEWELSIKDDGKGFDTDEIKSNGIGLTNMKNRAKIIGADFTLTSEKNIGTSLKIVLNK